MKTDSESAATAPAGRRAAWHTCFGIARTLAVYAALGLVTAVAVAWALAAWVPYRSRAGVRLFTSGYAPGANRIWTTSNIYSTLGGLRRYFVRQDEDTLRASYFGFPDIIVPPDHFEFHREPLPSIALGGNLAWGMAARPLPAGTPSERSWEDARGLPFVCLWQTVRSEHEYTPDRVSSTYQITGGIPLGHFGGTKHELTARGLPLRPIWRGLLANTAFYAICWFTVIRTSRLARRHRRITRGYCPRCAYDRESLFSMPCPECGWLPKRRAVPTSSSALTRAH